MAGKYPLKGLHPALVLTYGAFALALSMVSFQPLMAVFSIALAVTLEIALEGARASVGHLAWQIPSIAAIMILNSLLVSEGSTVLFSAGFLTIRLEAVVFGLCSGCVLVSTLTFAMLIGRSVSSDEAMAIFGAKAPVFALMLSASLKLVPRFRRESGEIKSAVAANTSSCRVAEGRKGAARILSTLMAQSMEDSIVMADSMNARGWSDSQKKTFINRRALRSWDILFLALVIAFGLCAVISCALASMSYTFYPIASESLAGIWMLFYALFAAIPFTCFAWEALRWKR